MQEGSVPNTMCKPGNRDRASADPGLMSVESLNAADSDSQDVFSAQ